MRRRLFFLFPDEEHALRVVDELVQNGLDRSHVHALAGGRMKLSNLSPATPQQRADKVWLLERLFWNGNLAVFTLALLGLLASLYWGFSTWSVLAIGIMLITFIVGERFAVTLPHIHLNEFRGALSHGEVLLMVDIPKERVAEIEELVHRGHPEAGVGGVGWTVEALGT